MTAATVTIAIPVYKRLQLLPHSLRSVEQQTYPAIDLLVSDNGGNGPALEALVAAHYSRPFRMRHNDVTVSVSAHFNELLAEAAGQYFVLLCDDDEISPDFVEELVQLLDRHPAASVAIPRAETIDTSGNVRQYPGVWADALEGVEFLRLWATKRIRLMSTVTVMARTDAARACGGYLDLPRALYSDNALVLRLALGKQVVLGQHCRFRWRIDATSTGFSGSYQEVAAACRGFLAFLDTDPQMQAFADADPAAWQSLRALLRHQCGSWFFFRWKDGYAGRLTTLTWIRAAFALPFIPSYYGMVSRELLLRAKTFVKALLPQ